MIKKLQEIAKKAYVPYSKFRVAALFELENGDFFEGFNIENAAYPNSLCAERVAIVSAINAGIDVTQVKNIHIFSPESKDFLSPCGGCRQSMSEFISQETNIWMYNNNGEYIKESFSTLFPYCVDPKNIKGEK